ncbi:uncharacterized protein LOC132045356 isoform X2 [Lycium ferocissimum]|uniref:uncharacterized protein LOC132045356 isoform X2 n=1 Tax=Lycium ferocissimum TaxID=112874 RepID=UPI002816968B|nr:uncharacterized protein LOC132045356 isoform X2 [Lycium ferocissimum]
MEFSGGFWFGAQIFQSVFKVSVDLRSPIVHPSFLSKLADSRDSLESPERQVGGKFSRARNDVRVKSEILVMLLHEAVPPFHAMAYRARMRLRLPHITQVCSRHCSLE